MADIFFRPKKIVSKKLKKSVKDLPTIPIYITSKSTYYFG
jgi:hypothetical protein